MTALLFYYFIFIIGGIALFLILYKAFDFIIDLLKDIITDITK